MERVEIERLLARAFRSGDPQVRNALDDLILTLTNNERAALYLQNGQPPEHPLHGDLVRVGTHALAVLARPGRAPCLALLQSALQ